MSDKNFVIMGRIISHLFVFIAGFTASVALVSSDPISFVLVTFAGFVGAYLVNSYASELDRLL